ncbi:hypothetical protein H0H93_008450 [Arthromyces matolae]|nr:hypothetical protein H0H93_008450 [Arthromyces matolae]
MPTNSISTNVPERHRRSTRILESVREEDSDDERGDDKEELASGLEKSELGGDVDVERTSLDESPSTNDDVIFPPWKSRHRTAKPLPSILKWTTHPRSHSHSHSHLEQGTGVEEEYEDVDDEFQNGDGDESHINRYVDMLFVHIILESSSAKRHHHRCPSCMFPCILNEPNSDSTSTPASSSSWSLVPTSSPKQILSKLLSFTLFELRQQGSDWPFPFPFAFPKITVSHPHSPPFPFPSPSPSLSPTSTSNDTKYHLDQSYTLFNTDDDAYPETEHTPALSSNLFTTDVQETSVRIWNVAGLTLVLFVLLSSTGVGLF